MSEEEIKLLRASRDYWRDAFFKEGAAHAKLQHRFGQIVELLEMFAEEDYNETLPAREE